DRAARLCRLLDHLVGAGEQRGWHFYTKRLRGRQIDDEVELGRLFDRDVGRLRPAQDLVDHVGCAPEQIRQVWTVGHETPCFDISAGIEHRRQPRAGRKYVYARKIGNNECIDHDVKRVRLALERREGGIDLLRTTNFECSDFDAERASRGLNLAHL